MVQPTGNYDSLRSWHHYHCFFICCNISENSSLAPKLFSAPYTQPESSNVGLIPSDVITLGIAFDVTANSKWFFWPEDARLKRPSTWAVAVSSDGWQNNLNL
jgi:hypothetical protein